MSAREALFVTLGFSAALLAALVVSLVTLGTSNRELQERLVALQRATDDDRVKHLQALLAEAGKREAELKQAHDRESSALRALERARAVEAEARIRAAERAASGFPPPAPIGPSSADQLYEQAAALERDGKGAEAVRTYTRAARSGSGKAAKHLGEIYDKGIPGVSRDYAESLKWYNTARALGEEVKERWREERSAPGPTSADALFERAEALEKNGEYPEAVNTYRLAARSGHGKAARRLGEIYGKGLPDVSMNYAESLKWLNTARALGEDVGDARR